MTLRNRSSSLGLPLGLVGIITASFGGCSADAQGDSSSVAENQSALTSYSASFQNGTSGYTGATDAYLGQNASATNYGTATVLVADGDEPNNSDKDASPVLRWNVSSIPTDATVTSVTIRFRVTDGSTNTYAMYPLKRDWTESSVTWASASSGTAWQTAGAQGALDRDTTSIGSLRASSASTVTVTLNSSGISAVQNWITNSAQNYGIIVASTSNTDGLRFASSNNSTVSYRPQLTVNYTRDTGGGTGGAPGTGGASGTGGAATGGSTGSNQVIAVGDIADCAVSSTGRNGTATLLDSLSGPVITMGDDNNMDGSLGTYNSCFNVAWGRHKSRIHPAPGNHDYMTSGAQGYVDYFTTAVAKPDGKTYYSYDVGNWHIIALDGNCTESQVGGCSASNAQATWLHQDLEAHSGNHCTLAYFHQPRFSSGLHGSNSSMQPVWQLLAEHGVEMVISGHDHGYERFNPMDANGSLLTNGKGVVQFVVGTGGASLRSFGTTATNSAKRIANTYGVLKLTLNSTGYAYAFTPIAGSTGSDSGSRNCYDP
jgi:hypothetical protein